MVHKNDPNLFLNYRLYACEMEIIVISNSSDVPNEVEEVVRMFNAGLSYFHIRKPRKDKYQLAEYIERFPDKFRKKMIIHSYHGLARKYQLAGIHLSRQHRRRKKFYKIKLWLQRKMNPSLIVTRSFHKLTDITHDRRRYSYAFLSPVFDSATSSALSGGYSKRALHVILPQAKQPVYALGGITLETIPKAAERGFDGVVFHGSMWNSSIPPHQIFLKAQKIIHDL